MKITTIFIYLSLIPGIMMSQKDVKSFTFKGQVLELSLKDSSEKGVMGIPIEIWSGDELIATIESGPKGKYSVSLVYYPNYRIKFGKAPYVNKIVEIDAKGFSRAAEFGVVNLDLDIQLFKNAGYLGMDFMDYTPVAIAKFNKKKGIVEWDLDYADQICARVNGIIQANKK